MPDAAVLRAQVEARTARATCRGAELQGVIDRMNRLLAETETATAERAQRIDEIRLLDRGTRPPRRCSGGRGGGA